MGRGVTRGRAPRLCSPPVRRVLPLAFVLFALALCGLAAVAWLAGDGSGLELDYEGFD